MCVFPRNALTVPHTRIGDDVIADTRAVWEPLYGRPLTDEEVHEILFNTAGLLRALFGFPKPHISLPGSVRPRDDIVPIGPTQKNEQNLSGKF
jgi:hypothetical protein